MEGFFSGANFEANQVLYIIFQLLLVFYTSIREKNNFYYILHTYSTSCIVLVYSVL